MKKQVILQHREKKKAKQKLAVAYAFVKHLEALKFEDVLIKDVCNDAEISEGTFYNYFPKKIDVIIYYREICFVKIVAHSKIVNSQLSAVQRINLIFDLLADAVSNPNLLYELSSLFIDNRGNHDMCKERRLTSAEVSCIDPHVSYDDLMLFGSLRGVFSTLLCEAKEQNELSREIDVDDIVLSLCVIMTGVPLSIERELFSSLKKQYQRQLTLLWKALQP